MRQRELPHPFRVENDKELVDEVVGDLLDVGVHGDEHTGGKEVEEVVSRYPTVRIAVVYLQAKNGQRMGKEWAKMVTQFAKDPIVQQIATKAIIPTLQERAVPIVGMLLL